jgi:hypothetical protein
MNVRTWVNGMQVDTVYSLDCIIAHAKIALLHPTVDLHRQDVTFTVPLFAQIRRCRIEIKRQLNAETIFHKTVTIHKMLLMMG